MAPLLFNECESSRMMKVTTDNFSTVHDDDYPDDIYQDEFVYEEFDQSHEMNIEATTMEILSSAIPSHNRYHQSLNLSSSDGSGGMTFNDRHSIFLRHQSNDDIIRHRNLQLGNSYNRRSNSISDYISQSICNTMNNNHTRTVFAMAQSLCLDVYSAKLVQINSDGCKLELTKVYYLINNTKDVKKPRNGSNGTNMKSSTMFDSNLKSNPTYGTSTFQQEVEEYYYPFETACYEEYHVWYEMINVHKNLSSPKVTWLLCNPLSALYLSCILSFVTQPSSEWYNSCHNNISTTTMLTKAICNYLLSVISWSSSPSESIFGRSISIYEIGIFLWIILISCSIIFRLYNVVRVIQYYSRYSYVFALPMRHHSSNASNNKGSEPILTTLNQWIFSILMVGLPAITEFQELKSIHQHYVTTIEKISKKTDTIRWEEY